MSMYDLSIDIQGSFLLFVNRSLFQIVLLFANSKKSRLFQFQIDVNKIK